jgi:hypothetical protein
LLQTNFFVDIGVNTVLEIEIRNDQNARLFVMFS